jgi:hypothetical protein
MRVLRHGSILDLILRRVLSLDNGVKVFIFPCIRGILGNLSESEQLNCRELARALSDRFAPPDQMKPLNMRFPCSHEC